MSIHEATIEWRRLTSDFDYATYDRGHWLEFGADIRMPGTAARANIPPTAPASPGIDPEQAFVASLSSCHMLWFLHLACNRKFKVTRYHDEAVGVLEKRADGKEAITRVTLRPAVSFDGAAPSPEQHAQLHEKAHERCFVANSVNSKVTVEPSIAP
jgi:organic hydroperoxide reductase OsmC/OhrA